VGNDRQWRTFCELLGNPQLADDVRFTNSSSRLAHRDELTTLVESALAAKTADEWVATISQSGIPCGPIYDYSQVLASDQVAALGLVQHTERADGSPLPLLRGPLSLDGVPSEILAPPPALGEHTTEVLREIGYSAADIDRLEAAGHIKTNEEAAQSQQ
jgi:CoA:oxalate CoA-transferase